jgi:NAD(P)-dependent dehydrogenase (short-subunit alcohol dehydrogenase family)
VEAKHLPMTGRVCMVTGATSGIGKAIAHGLAERGATTVGIGRNSDKSRATAQEIQQDTRNPYVEYLVADLSVQAQIRRLVEEFKGKYDRLHVLVNDAGGLFVMRQKTADGIEMTFALNHLSYFLLTNLLLDLLIASAPSRIINVSSDAHRGEEIDFDDLQMERTYNGWGAYGRSKLANVLFTYELARRLKGTGVTVNAYHPGGVATNFGVNNPGFMRMGGRTPERGAQTGIYLATSPEVEGVTGKYFYDEKTIPSSPESRDEAAARRLWEISVRMTGLKHSDGA